MNSESLDVCMKGAKITLHTSDELRLIIGTQRQLIPNMEIPRLVIGSEKLYHICKHNVNTLKPDECYLCDIENKYHIDIDSSKYKHIGIENRNGKDIITLEPW